MDVFGIWGIEPDDFALSVVLWLLLIVCASVAELVVESASEYIYTYIQGLKKKLAIEDMVNVV